MRTLEVIQNPDDYHIEEDEIHLSPRDYKRLVIGEGRIRLNDTDGKPLVLRARESEVREGMAIVSYYAFARLSGEYKPSQPEMEHIEIPVGADPEWFFWNKKLDKVLTAWWLEKAYKNMGGRFGIERDGAGIIGEFRPNPGKDFVELTENIRKLVDKAESTIIHAFSTDETLTAKCMDTFGEVAREDWTLGGYSWKWYLPAGFHIHFGLPSAVLKNLNFLTELAFALDYFLAIPALINDRDWERRVPLSEEESGTDDYRLQNRGKFGHPGSHRTSILTMEYRVLGGYLMRHPVLSNGAIAIGQMVIEDFIARVNQIEPGLEGRLETITAQYIYGLPPRNMIVDELLSRNSTNLGEFIEDGRKKMEGMMNFKKYQSAIDKFLEVADYPPNIIDNWRV